MLKTHRMYVTKIYKHYERTLFTDYNYHAMINHTRITLKLYLNAVYYRTIVSTGAVQLYEKYYISVENIVKFV